MEELLVLVKELADSYTGKASTSVTYETARQLIRAILYCINESAMDQQGIGGAEVAVKEDFSTAREAYENGYRMVVTKVRKANELYTDIIMDFNAYGNTAYQDTVVKGIPEFFRWYDPVLNPENHILTLDYPILKKLQDMEGIDVIYEYLRCIRLEQIFLKQFPETFIKESLILYDEGYEELLINICSIVLRKVLTNLLFGLMPEKIELDCEDYKKIYEMMNQKEKEQLLQQLSQLLKQLIINYYEAEEELLSYLSIDLTDLTTELRNAAAYGSIENLI